MTIIKKVLLHPPPNRKIRICLLDAPITFHDITMVGYGIYEGMEKFYNKTGGKVVVDSAFNLASHESLIKYSQQDPMDLHALLVNWEATSVMQLSEWGMQMIQRYFRHLKTHYIMKKKVIMTIIWLMAHLYNFQTAQVGIHQVMKFFTDKTQHLGHDVIAANADNILY